MSEDRVIRDFILVSVHPNRELHKAKFGKRNGGRGDRLFTVALLVGPQIGTIILVNNTALADIPDHGRNLQSDKHCGEICMPKDRLKRVCMIVFTIENKQKQSK